MTMTLTQMARVTSHQPIKGKYPYMMFRGRRYYQYRQGSTLYYRTNYETGRKRLHRDVWQFHYGPIPDRMHIHHIDGNTLNNDISNLEMLTPSEHVKLHPFPANAAAKGHAAQWNGFSKEEKRNHIAKLQAGRRFNSK